MQVEYSCPDCSETVEDGMLQKHIKQCRAYKPHLLRQVSKILESSANHGQLKFLQAELQMALNDVRNKLKDKSGSKRVIKKMEEEKSAISYDVSAFDQDLVECKSCHNKFYSSFDLQSLFYVEECWHLFCIACIRKYINNEFVNKCGCLPCLVEGCKKNISDYQIKSLVGEKKFELMQTKAIQKMMNIVECCKCHDQYEFVEGNPNDAPKKDNNGKPLTKEHAEHFARNRLVCSKADCKTEQCKECHAVPFHIAMTCKEFKAHALARKCRYCDSELNEKNINNTVYDAHRDICNQKECLELVKNACTKMLGCGHACSGFRGEDTCLPCLDEKCCEDNPDLVGQKGEDYCAICYIEALTAAPCIRSACGHIFHMKCLQKRLQIKWLTPRILFNFCLCPLCKKWMQIPKESPLSKGILQNADLFVVIQKMSLERLKFEECDKDEKLKDKKSPYFQKPTEYAMAIYAYFMCFKCKKPYFGGRKNCADAMNQGANQADYKKEELICPNCCEIPIQNCAKHGRDFIEFKCKYCCSTAQWFCWGNTHFCQPCHKRQCEGDYVSKYTKDKLPKCPGVGKCPIGGNHNGNGDEKTLGCAICRNYKENNKSF